MKVLINFDKGETARWLGHLDILRTFERAIRRAQLPIAFSAGFNPREKIAFASALSVGVTGDAELATLEFAEAVNPADIVSKLNNKLPAGIQLHSAEEIPDIGSRDLLNSFDRAEISVLSDVNPDTDPGAIQQAADSLLARTSVQIQREREGRSKAVDIRPLIHIIELEKIEGDRATLKMILALGQDGTAKPQEIVELIAREIPGLRVRRVHRRRLLSRDSRFTETSTINQSAEAK